MIEVTVKQDGEVKHVFEGKLASVVCAEASDVEGTRTVRNMTIGNGNEKEVAMDLVECVYAFLKGQCGSIVKATGTMMGVINDVMADVLKDALAADPKEEPQNAMKDILE